jgi:hypothetical protein
MPFEFIQVAATGQGNAKDELNRLLRGGRIASVRKEFVAHGQDSFWAFCIEYLDGQPGAEAILTRYCGQFSQFSARFARLPEAGS